MNNSKRPTKFTGKGQKSNTKYSKDASRDKQPSLDFTKDRDKLVKVVKDLKQDVEWYKKFPTLFDYVSHKSWSYRQGTGLRALDANDGLLATPAVLSIDYIPTIGNTMEAQNSFSVISRALWLELHRLYRGIGTYEYTDLAVTILGMMDMFASVAEAERIYAIMYKYSAINRAIPYTLQSALRLNPGFGDIAEYRNSLNIIISKLQSLVLPKGATALDRWINMSSRIFKDSDSDRATLMLYVKTGYWKYQSTKLKGGCLEWTPYYGGSGSRTAIGIIADLESQLNALLADTDVARICSDLLAAVAKKEGVNSSYNDVTGIWKLMPVPEDYSIPFEHDIAWIKQMHNTYCGLTQTNGVYSNKIPAAAQPTTPISTTFGFMIMQDPSNGTIVCEPCQAVVPSDQVDSQRGAVLDPNTGNTYQGYQPASSKNPAIIPTNLVIDTDTMIPDADEIMEITRNANYTTLHNNTSSYNAVVHSGSEIFGPFHLDALYIDPATNQFTFDRQQISTVQRNLSRNSLGMMCQVDWHPLVISTASNLSDFTTVAPGVPNFAADYQSSTYLVELDNPCTFTAKELNELNECALYSEFNMSISENLIKE